MNFINNYLRIFLAIICISTLFSCEKSDDKPEGFGGVRIEFDNTANGDELLFGKAYTNAAGEELVFKTFNYFVSNIQLIRTDGTVYTIPQDSSYFLVTDTGGINPEIELQNIPAGDYNQLRFIIGVDSARSVASPEQRKGALDISGAAKDMYWDANNGYIFLKLEGTSTAAPLDSATGQHIFSYHIGQYGGAATKTLNNIRQINLSHDEAAEIRTNIAPEIHLKIDVMELFKNPTTIYVATHPQVAISDYSAVIANNYTDMFKIDHIHN